MHSDQRLYTTSRRPAVAVGAETAGSTRRAFLGALLAVAATAPDVAVAAGASRGFPPNVSLTPGGTPLVRMGSGRFRFFFVPYYDCALYVMPELKDAPSVLAADAPRRFVIDALRNISAFEFIWGLDQGLNDNSTRTELKAMAQDLERVRATVRAAKGLERGMRGVLDYLPGIGVLLLLNDVPQGPAIGGKALADALFKVWLGERPLDASLKEALFAG